MPIDSRQLIAAKASAKADASFRGRLENGNDSLGDGGNSPGGGGITPPETSRLFHSVSDSLSTSLLVRVRSGDDEAWHKLVHLYSPMVYRLCRRSNLQQDDAEDVAQEVFRAVSRAVGQFERREAGSSFRGWFWTIARNKIRDHLRAKAGRANAVGGTHIQRRLVEIPDVGEDQSVAEPAEDDQQRMLHAVLEMIRSDFEPNTWTAFWRATVKGHTVAEIAEDLQMSKPAIRQSKYRVLRRLRQEIGDLL